MAGEESRFVIRLRGLPWSATDIEIMNFLNCDLVGGKDGIRRTFTKEGRPSGEAYVELRCHDDVNNCLDKDHSSMGRRYIEVFQSSIKEMEYVLSRSGDGHTDHSHGDRIVRMRGLPYQCTKEEIAQFFVGLEIVPNGISLPLEDNGRSTGEAYVEFATQQGADGALAKHKEKIGHRYIEIFKSTRRELNMAFGEYERPYGGRGRPSPYDRPRGGRGMRGGRFGGRGGRGGRISYGGGYGGGEGDFYDDYEEDEEDYSWNDGGYGGNGGGGGRFRGRGRGGGMKGYSGGRNYGSGGGGGGGNYDNYGGGGGGGFGGNYAEDEEYYNDDEGGMGSQHIVHLRGLPFKANDVDISNFFSPIVPVRIHREFGRDGRVSGEADVEFASYQDSQAAMQKDGESMKHRYIELFLRGSGSNVPQRGGRGRRRGNSGGYGGGRGGGFRY